MKLQAPRGCRAISIGAAELVPGADGIVEVPDAIAQDLIAYHGFARVPSAGARPRAAPAKAKAPKTRT